MPTASGGGRPRAPGRWQARPETDGAGELGDPEGAAGSGIPAPPPRPAARSLHVRCARRAGEKGGPWGHSDRAWGAGPARSDPRCSWGPISKRGADTGGPESQSPLHQRVPRGARRAGPGQTESSPGKALNITRLGPSRLPTRPSLTTYCVPGPQGAQVGRPVGPPPRQPRGTSRGNPVTLDPGRVAALVSREAE